MPGGDSLTPERKSSGATEAPDFTGAPTDFEAYEKWANERTATPVKESATETPSADTAEKKVESKTATESDTDHEGEDKDAETPQKKSGFQRRIDKLNRKIGERDAQIAELMKRTQGGGDAATRTPEAAKQEQKPAAAANDGKPVAADFESYEEYVEKLAEWKLDQREAAKAQAEAAKTQQEAHKARLAAAQERYADFDEVLGEVEDFPISQAMHEVITASDHGLDVAYYLAKNQDEAHRIAELSPFLAAKELGKIEAKIADKVESKSSTEKETKPRVSKAPAPPKTVRPQAESAEPDPSDFGAWERWRNAQPGASLRR